MFFYDFNGTLCNSSSISDAVGHHDVVHEAEEGVKMEFCSAAKQLNQTVFFSPFLSVTDPRIGMGRDLSIFQIGESQKHGVHSNLGTNRYMKRKKELKWNFVPHAAKISGL
jgi:hypothetical protein